MPTARDAGQMLAPVLILSFVPLWAVSMVVTSPDSLVVQLFTFFPYTAPVTAMIRNGLGTLSTAQAAVVIVELFVFGAVMLRFAVRLFRYGAISYGRRVSVREVLAKRQ
jgi:ABC-2 type transport system permease protein